MSHLPVSISRVFIGTIIHVNTPSTLEILVPGVLGVSHDGKIAFVDKIPRVDGKTREESIDDEVTLRAALSPSSEVRLKMKLMDRFAAIKEVTLSLIYFNIIDN